MKRLLIIGLLAFAGMNCLAQTAEERLAEKEKEGRLLIGKPAPDFKVTTLADSVLALSSLKGKVVVLNFWYAGCPPCLMEIDALNSLVAKYRGKEVVFIGISASDKPEKLKTFLQRIPFSYQIVPENISIAQQYGVKLYPTNVVIDTTGKVIFFKSSFDKHIGKIVSKEIDKYLQSSETEK